MSTKIVEINGGLVTTKNVYIEKEIRVDDFLEELRKSMPMQTPMLPKLPDDACCRMYISSKSENSHHHEVFVVEREPGITDCVFSCFEETIMRRSEAEETGRRILGSIGSDVTEPDDEDDDEDDDEEGSPANSAEHENQARARQLLRVQVRRSNTYKLAWPRTLWFFKFNNSTFVEVIVAAIDSPLVCDGVDTPLFIMPMYNVYDGGQGRICLGDSLRLDATLPVRERLETIYNFVFQSPWNEDLQPDWRAVGLDTEYSRDKIIKPGVPIVRPIDVWRDKTSSVPDFYKGLVVTPHIYATVKLMIENLLQR